MKSSSEREADGPGQTLNLGEIVKVASCFKLRHATRKKNDAADNWRECLGKHSRCCRTDRFLILDLISRSASSHAGLYNGQIQSYVCLFEPTNNLSEHMNNDAYGVGKRMVSVEKHFRFNNRDETGALAR